MAMSSHATHVTHVGSARTFTVHWADLAKLLPIADDEACKSRRRELFEVFDPQGGGILSQARVVRALFRMLPQVSGISDMRLVVHQAWGVTRDLIQPISPIGIDRMDRNQFRCLCIYLWYFFKFWDLFVQISDTGTQTRKVSQKLFEEVLPFIRSWGIQDVAMWQDNPEACFALMDRNKQGWVMFEDLAEWILRRSVVQLSSAGEEDCRAEAIRLLKRTHPHLLAKPFPTKERSWNGACPPVPPPGQRRPPMPIELDGGMPGMTSPNRRYKTQYMCDFIAPQYLPAEVGLSSSPSRSRSMSRALTPRGPVRPPSDLQVGIGLIRSSSCPNETMRTQGMDKAALRGRLENQLDMYSTGQMRKLLKVAGGMVVGPGNAGR